MTGRLRHLGWLAATAAARPLQFVGYALAGLVPRRRGLWVFGSWGGYRFADNAAAFYRYCRGLDRQDLQPVWISRDRKIVEMVRREGGEAHWIWSCRGALACLRAEVYLFDNFVKDINFWLSRGALLVNLWSGVPLKAFERDIDQPNSRYYRLFHGPAWQRLAYGTMMPWHAKRPDLLIATSTTTADITRRAFDVNEDAVVVTGFPRNDALLEAARGDTRTCPPQLIDDVEAGRPTFLYLPTYRDSAEPYIDIDWGRLHDLLESVDGRFYLKFHPDDRSSFEHPSDRIVQLFQDTDVYDLLPHTSVLVSDYSSIIFDFMVLGRPIIHYMPDLERFVAGSRRLVFEPTEVAVGPICLDGAQLLVAVADLAAVPVGGAPVGGASARQDERRQAVMTMLHRHVDDRASSRVLAAVDQLRARR